MPATSLPTASDPTAATEAPAHAMACVEIWGGNEPTSTAVSTPGIDAYIYSRPFESQHAGGDIHYVSLCSAGNIARFVVADVAGHGAEVAELASGLRGMMRRNINTLDQTRFARSLNRLFSQENTSGRFATALLATYWAPDDQLILCNAGHPRPMHYRAEANVWSVLEDRPGVNASEAPGNLPLGIIHPTPYTQSAYPLKRDDVVVIYTDALVEAKSPSGEMLREAGLLEMLGSIDPRHPDRLIEALLTRIAEFTGGRPLDDDVTVLVLHHNAADPPTYTLGEKVAAVGRWLGLRH